MNDYQDLNLDKAYKLVGHGPVVWVSTVCRERYNLAPIAWNCPVYKDPTRILVAVGSSHKTYEDIRETGSFIVCVPNIFQVELVRQTGSVSGHKVDKFEEFCIETQMGSKVKAKIPIGCVGFAECRLVEHFELDQVGLFVGECLKAGINSKVYKDERLRVEEKEAKTIHHLGNKVFAVPADEIDS
jgi:flavin reductase (DIM6/NTAB) family NADH-FMN oxidoreductase RutF